MYRIPVKEYDNLSHVEKAKYGGKILIEMVDSEGDIEIEPIEIRLTQEG